MAHPTYVSDQPVSPGSTRLVQLADATGRTIRAYRDHLGGVWFLAVDVWRTLGLTSREASRYKARIRSADDLARPYVWVINGMRQLDAISEGGMHHMLGVSRQERCAEFRQWMVRSALPQVRGVAA